MKRCPYCAEEIQDEAIVCRFCNRSLTAPPPVPSVAALAAEGAPKPSERLWNPGVAAVLSFLLPGLGQLYKGKLLAGFALFVGAIVGYAMFIVPGIIVHVAAVVNAYAGDPYQR